MSPASTERPRKVEVLEFFEIGPYSKWALWQALAAIAGSDPRLNGVNLKHLAERAESQRAAVDQRRFEIARVALQKECTAGQS